MATFVGGVSEEMQKATQAAKAGLEAAQELLQDSQAKHVLQVEADVTAAAAKVIAEQEQVRPAQRSARAHRVRAGGR